MLAGFFACFCGLIYNDLTALPTQIFGYSCYDLPEDRSTSKVALRSHKECNYKFGIDPIWYSSEQEITFLNGFKMKMSVMYGVWQMSIGTILKGFNAVNHRDWVELIFIVFTELAMLWALFGLMDAMIIKKWLTDWFDDYYVERKEAAPQIIGFMIQMFIYQGVKQPPNQSGW